MHTKIPHTNAGGLNFLNKLNVQGNAMPTLFLGIVKLINLASPFYRYKLLKDVSDAKNLLVLYVIAMVKLALINENKAKILI